MVRDFSTADNPNLRATATAWLSGEHPEPVAPRPAATVMIVRDGTAGVEVFMLRRVASMAFAPSTMVFPGGGVDRRDAVDLPWAGPGVLEWSARLGADEAATRMLVVAAVREVFEECGVLFASTGAQGPLVDAGTAPWQGVRAGLVAREQSLAEVLLAHGLRLRSDLLRAHAHWVTPEFEARRFDTRFFVALMPEGATLDGATSEADHAAWFPPQEVLDAAARREAIVLPPTQVCLEQLAECATAAEFFDQTPVIRRLAPVLVFDDEGHAVLRVDFAGTKAPRGGG
jgi:8-oxo-dGTP pyrophosphatase MutT (NUDIX family)